MQKSIFSQKLQKSLCITTKSLYINSNFKRDYIENYNDSEHAVKTKNAPFFMIFPNISFFHMVVNYWTGPLKGGRGGGLPTCALSAFTCVLFISVTMMREHQNSRRK